MGPPATGRRARCIWFAGSSQSHWSSPLVFRPRSVHWCNERAGGAQDQESPEPASHNPVEVVFHLQQADALDAQSDGRIRCRGVSVSYQKEGGGSPGQDCRQEHVAAGAIGGRSFRLAKPAELRMLNAWEPPPKSMLRTDAVTMTHFVLPQLLVRPSGVFDLGFLQHLGKRLQAVDAVILVSKILAAF